jgi:glycosyltransferase involved in cell wall biosynthesis
MRIFAFHLLNDYSGSPKVLSQLLKGWVKNGVEVNMVTCKGREGFLSDIEGVKYHYYKYKFSENKWIRLFNLTYSQLIVFLKFLTQVKKNDIVYVNTVLPFGAGVLGKFKGCRVIYHVHETTMKPPILKKFLFGVAKWSAKDVIFVSKYLQAQESFKKVKSHVIYNAIEDEFYEKAKINREISNHPKNVLMVCSLKDYKGVREFYELSKLNPQFEFKLVVNAIQQEIDHYFIYDVIPSNLLIFPTQTNLHPFYKWADVILNLSRPDGWVETFGLTIIEGMAYGLPAIVPPIGGITELVDEGENGLKVDSRDLQNLHQKLNQLLENETFYKKLSTQSILKIKRFSEEEFIRKSLQIITEK